MIYRAVILLPGLALALAAQGTAPKESAQEYTAHAALDKASLGAEYLVHSFSSGRDMYIAKDYLVVEVAVFPAKGASFDVNDGQFVLRVNGHKQELSPQGAQFVAESLKHPDNSSGLHSVEQVGPWVMGMPRPTSPFPGDPNAQPQRQPPQAPTDTASDRGDVEKQPSVSPAELAVEAALPEGSCHSPTSGFLYFPYRGKVSHIHSLELIYSGPAGAATVSLPLE